MIRTLALAVVALTLACSTGHAQGVNGTSFQLWQQGTGPFYLTDHYISNHTGLVLSLYSNPEELRNFAPNFRGLPPDELPFKPKSFKEWRIEYFCQPDYMLGEYDSTRQSVAYFGKLRWAKSLWLDPKTDTLKLSYRHLPGYGLIHEGVDEAYLRDSGKIETELTLSFTWQAKANHLTATLEIRNAGKVPKDYTFAAQDAAYLWFPNQSQQNLEGFVFRQGTIGKEPFWLGDGVPHNFAGTYSKTHGIVSGFRALTAKMPDNVTVKSAAGTCGFYLLVPPSVPIGFQVPLQDKGHDFDHLIKTIQNCKSPLLNRYLAFHFKNVQPGQSCSVVFQLIMGTLDPKADIAGQLGNFVEGL